MLIVNFKSWILIAYISYSSKISFTNFLLFRW